MMNLARRSGHIQSNYVHLFSKVVKTIDPIDSRNCKSFVRLVAVEHATTIIITESIEITVYDYRKIPKSFRLKTQVGFKW